MRIPYVRNRRHEMTLLVAERTRLDGPDRGARGYGSGKHQLAANMFSHSVSPNRAVSFYRSTPSISFWYFSAA